jgi:hypothetical protein
MAVQTFHGGIVERGIGGCHEGRVVVACLSAATVGHAQLGDDIRHGNGLDRRPDDEVDDLLVAIFTDVARSAFPSPGPAGGRAEAA